MMFNQFICGMQPELAHFVSLQYPKSITQAVSLAETTELAEKASRRLANKINMQKGPNQSNRGRGFWGSGTSRGRGQGGGRNMGNSGGRGHGTSGRRGGRGGSSSFDPLACYRCGVHGHLAHDCPSSGTQWQTLGSSSSAPTRGSSFKSWHLAPKQGRGRGRQVRFGAMGIFYDDKGNEYPIDDYGQLYVPLRLEQIAVEEAEEEKDKNIKN